MAGFVFGIGFLDQLPCIHECIVKRTKSFPRGSFVISMYTSHPPKLKNEVFVCFGRLIDFDINPEGNDYAIASEAIAQSIKQYDMSYQYCLMVEIDGQIIGGGFIPLDDPEEFKSIVNAVIAEYNSERRDY